jgi:hypothetical protein
MPQYVVVSYLQVLDVNASRYAIRSMFRVLARVYIYQQTLFIWLWESIQQS